MGEALVDATKLEMARATARAMFGTMAGVPPEVQLEAISILFQTLVCTSIPERYRISTLNSITQTMRNNVKKFSKTGVL